MRIVTEDAILDRGAIILEVDDDALKRIQNDADYYLDTKFMHKITDQHGHNVVVTFLNIDDDVRILRKRLKDLLRKYKTVSWWSREHKKFYTRRGKCTNSTQYTT